MATRKEYYSEEKHAQRLRTMLLQVTETLESVPEIEVEDLVLPKMCPAAPNFNGNESPADYWVEIYDDYHPCSICCRFVGLSPRFANVTYLTPNHGCPCERLENPISDSFKALKERGYYK